MENPTQRTACGSQLKFSNGGAEAAVADDADDADDAHRADAPTQQPPAMSKLLSLLAILATSTHANDTTCGDDPDTVPNCDKPDHGSCGNAWYAAP